MTNKKLGMTLGEILITMSIMAFIAMIAIMTVKPFEKALRSLYARAFESVANASYNAYLDNSEDTFFSTPKKLCEGLIEYMNTSYTNCDIADGELATNQTTNFTDIEPHFIASNAMRFYITKQYEHTEEDDYGVDTPIKYFIVYVDLTGERPPNSTVWSEKKACDVVAFIVTESADVIPIGPPEIDTRYVTATVSFPACMCCKDGYNSTPMSYWDAKHVAWGDNTDSTEMMSLNFSNDLPADSPLKVSYPTPPQLNNGLPATTCPESCETNPTVQPCCKTGCTEETSPCDVVFDQYY